MTPGEGQALAAGLQAGEQERPEILKEIELTNEDRRYLDLAEQRGTPLREEVRRLYPEALGHTWALVSRRTLTIYAPDPGTYCGE